MIWDFFQQITAESELVPALHLLVAVLFIVGIKLLGSQRRAAKGNGISAIAMAIAIITTLFVEDLLTYQWIVMGAGIGIIIGGTASRLVKMTAMPQMVALYNGLGGAASGLVALSEFIRVAPIGSTWVPLSAMMFSLLIGGITLTGSLVAFSKLQEWIGGNAIVFPLQHLLNALLIIIAVGCGISLVINPAIDSVLWGLIAIALLLGILVVIPIGGADMPVVIALLNAYSGIAVSCTGFVLNNQALIIVGSLVGASGILLTNEMCKGMNRSIWNVLLGGFGVTQGEGTANSTQGGIAKSADAEEAALILSGVSSVVVVPGYGMAAAQAQHQVHALQKALEKQGVKVRYAIHPVAGRMPGHMNVLLAEANVSYDLLCDMEEINADFQQTDAVLVIGANDVVNPAANDDPSSPIYGMPILNVEQARTVMVLKRSMNPGFAGVDNPLFYKDNTLMVFGDAKATLSALTQGVESI